MYIDASCPGLGIVIKISSVSVGPSVIDPNEECCINRCTFLLTHIILKAGDKLKRPTKESFYAFLFDDTEENVAVRFEGKMGQDAIYDITLCKYFDPYNELHIDIRYKVLVCGTFSVRDHGVLWNEKCLKFILKECTVFHPFRIT